MGLNFYIGVFAFYCWYNKLLQVQSFSSLQQKETRQQVTARISIEDDAGLVTTGSRVTRGKQLDSGYMSEAEMEGFAGGLQPENK